MAQSAKPSLQDPKLSHNNDYSALLEVVKTQNETLKNDLRDFISSSLSDNATKLRNELRSDLNEVIENQKKEWALYKRDVDHKLKLLEDKLKSETSSNENNIATLQLSVDKLSGSLDIEKLELLNSLSKKDLSEIKRLSTEIPTQNISIKANSTKISELVDTSNFIEKQNSENADAVKGLKDQFSKLTSDQD